jgi:hypothetical protein
MRVERDEAGDLWLRGVTPLCADTLVRLPGWLLDDDPAVRGRLLPCVYQDRDEQTQWQRLGAVELERLFLSRAEILRKDLETLAPDGPMTYRVRIKKGHERAWLSSLNGGRLALFTSHELTAQDMETDPADAESAEKELALVRIHVMAWMQELMLRLGDGTSAS